MWNASCDNRKFVLRGKFKKLFVRGVYETLELFFQDGVVNHPDDEGFITTSGPYHQPFENLSNVEKIYSVAYVTRALISNKVKSPKLYQWNESAVYAVFESIKHAVCFEVDMEEEYDDKKFKYYWRNLISDAVKEFYAEECCDDETLSIYSTNLDEWTGTVDWLADAILWDRDFEEDMADPLVDSSPDKSFVLKQMLGISEDYYTKTINVTEEKLRKSQAFLQKAIRW